MANARHASQADTAAPIFGFDPGLANGMLMQPKALADMMTAWSTEAMRFTGQRLRAQADLLDRLRRCETLQDMMKHHMDFVQKANADYAEELGVLTRIAQASANGTAETKPN
jgi:hypothetical protein